MKPDPWERQDPLSAYLRRLFVRAYRARKERATGRPSTWGDRWMHSWDGGDHPNGRRYAAVWPKMAADCLAHQFNPVDFVRAQFDRDRLPEANWCHGPRAVERCRKAGAEADHLLRVAYASQRQTLAVEASARRIMYGLDDREAIRAVILDPHLSLSGLFRFVIANRFGYPEEAARYRAPALFQYVFRRDAYDRTWKDIPDGLRRDAASALAGLEGATHV